MVKATYKDIPVEVLAEYRDGNEKFAVVKAIEGKPFMNKEKIMTKTEYSTVKFDELIDIGSNSNPESDDLNLLDKALAYIDKQQWYAGESVWLWRNGNKGAYLKEIRGFFVTLNLIGYQEYLIVFHLNPNTWKWEVSQNVFVNYFQWIDQYERDLP